MKHPRAAGITRDRRAFLFAGLASVLATQLPVHAETFPAKVIRIIPFGVAGAPLDVISRVYAEKLSQRWGRPVIVDPKPGASGILAADAVAKAAPDGYTILITLPLTHVSNVFLQEKLPYDAAKDFQPLSQLAIGGPMLVARADAPYATLKEFVAYAKGKPGVTYGSWGVGSDGHLLSELLSRQNDLQMVHIAYKTQAAAHNDMLGRAIDVAWANAATAKAMTDAGKMKVLGIAGTSRVPTMPSVPTFAEQGFKGFELESWIGAYAPAKTPPAIVDAWVKALLEITAMPDVQARLVDFGFKPLGSTPNQFLTSYKADLARTAELIKAAGVTAN